MSNIYYNNKSNDNRKRRTTATTGVPNSRVSVVPSTDAADDTSVEIDNTTNKTATKPIRSGAGVFGVKENTK
ncbi:hypothetical protein [Tissierella praeacuta]|uniref:hypothetical protein n=1 Tax=Tissierella praeacuta TaxID=43131 RepID=UPI0033422934